MEDGEKHLKSNQRASLINAGGGGGGGAPKKKLPDSSSWWIISPQSISGKAVIPDPNNL